MCRHVIHQVFAWNEPTPAPSPSPPMGPNKKLRQGPQNATFEDELIDDFTEHINSVHPAIKFTREEESEDGTLPMLDTKTTRNPSGKLSFTVYRKPTHTDQYLQFNSNQPLQHKLGVIRTLSHPCSNSLFNR